MKELNGGPKARGRSSTADILGGATSPHPIPAKWRDQHRRLTELRDWFSGKRDSGSESAHSEIQVFGEHMADAATDSYDRDCALALLSSAQNALYEIDQALNRLEQGTYGSCELTGKPIEVARLKAIPWTRFSAEAQAQLEATGSGRKTQLAPVGTYESVGQAEQADAEALEEMATEREAA